MTNTAVVDTDSIQLAGAGKMGGPLLGGWLSTGVSGARITVVDPNPSADLQSLCRDKGIRLNPLSAAPVDTLALAIKPQMLEDAASTLAAWSGPDTLLVSVLAGKTVGDLAARFPETAAMAGLPADLAGRLARATVEGAGELMYRSPATAPDILRQNVTSPGGTTAAALDVLMAETGLQPLLDAAVAAAWRRARELAG